jgi:uncharacterized protein DUF4258
VSPYGVPEYTLSEHALFEMKRRAVSEDVVREILFSSEQRVEVRPGRVVLQSRVWMGKPAKGYLVRVFVDVDRDPAEVVTVYRTSKINKYWSVEL